MHSKFTPKIWSAPKFHSKSFGVHLNSTAKVLECTSSPLQNFWSALQVHSKKFGVNSKSTPKNWSAQNSAPKMSYFWSEQLPTPIFLEWTVVHSIFFGVDTFPLQIVGVHVVKVWSAFSLTHFFIICIFFLVFLMFFMGLG
jgi:hypothetical protein